MIRRPYAAILVLFTALVTACGSDKGGGVGPNGSKIVISPSAITFAYTGADLAGGPILLGPNGVNFITVTLLNASGNPVKGAKVSLFNAGDNSMIDSNKTGDFGSLQLEPFVGTTDDLGNVYVYILVVSTNVVGSSSYDFQAFSGGAFTKMTITRTCTDTNTATANVCD